MPNNLIKNSSYNNNKFTFECFFDWISRVYFSKPLNTRHYLRSRGESIWSVLADLLLKENVRSSSPDA
ncbi:CLUMA_CG006838, isoform A [Clunio marinus]|uniref:CLUMA_CG006838, isoform A n=1 Tax=Clunio marinus TaxID=568069 RepID=A0A1J1HYX1_9DIPT|nr:CLUMA_CG006838, isoform A [Clunio marinus]